MACLTDEFLRRLRNVMVSIDQTLYCFLTLGHSNPDWTLSACAWRWELENKPVLKHLRPIIDALFWFDPDHCQESYHNEVSR